MHSDEIDIDAELVRRLVAAQFPDWAALSVEAVPSSGTDNALFRLGPDKVVRLPRTPGVAKHVARERIWPPRLAPHLPAAIPTVLASGTPGPDFPYPWSVYPWFNGHNPIAGEPAAGLASDLARFLEALQRIDATGGPAGSRGGPLSTRDSATRQALSELDGFIDVNAAEREWERALRIPPWAKPPVWIHSDLSPFNLVCRDGRLHAVIDIGGVCVGDPACDLIVAWNLLGKADRAILREHVDDATWERGRGWALSIALIQLPYYVVTNPGLAGNARYTIGEVLGD